MTKIITARMIRDLLGLHGTMNMESLENRLKAPKAEFNNALEIGLERGDIIVQEINGHLFFSTDWVNDVKKREYIGE